LNFFSLFKRNLIYKFKKKISIDENTNEKKSLDDLFYFYGSDKANIFRLSNEKGHGYSLFYEEQLQHFKKKELKVLTKTDGYSSPSWIIIDTGEIMIHLFHKKTREYYNLESLWSDKK